MRGKIVTAIRAERSSPVEEGPCSMAADSRMLFVLMPLCYTPSPHLGHFVSLNEYFARPHLAFRR